MGDTYTNHVIERVPTRDYNQGWQEVWLGFTLPAVTASDLVELLSQGLQGAKHSLGKPLWIGSILDRVVMRMCGAFAY